MIFRGHISAGPSPAPSAPSPRSPFPPRPWGPWPSPPPLSPPQTGGVNFWEAPAAPSTWKAEQAVLIIFAGWGALIASFTAGGGGDAAAAEREARYQALKTTGTLPEDAAPAAAGKKH